MSGGPNMEEAAMAHEGVAHDDAAGRYSRHQGDMHYPSGTTASMTNGINGFHKESTPRNVV
jgi:hypothetical protein